MSARASRTWVILAVGLFTVVLLSVGPVQADPLKCEREIVKRSIKLAQDQMKILQKCYDKLVADKLGPDPGPGLRLDFCLAEPKTALQLAKAASKLQKSVDTKCGGGDKSCGTGGDDVALGDVGWGALSACPDFEGLGCTNSITDCNGISECLICVNNAAVRQAVTLYYDDLADVNPSTEKALNKCQRAIGKETSKLFKKRSNELRKCADNILKGRFTGPCPDAKGALKIAAASDKARAQICKACGGVDKACGGAADFDPQNDIGFRSECDNVTVPGEEDCFRVITDLQDLVDCVDCVTKFKSDCLDAIGAPNLTSYPAGCEAEIPSPPLPDGDPCTDDVECLSGNCVDGVCCDAACDGTCQACDLAGNEGTCTCYAAETDVEGECSPGECDGACGCEQPDGTPCGSEAECVSGNCVDGVCCDSLCDGLCDACNLAGSQGTCACRIAGTDPEGECGPENCNGFCGCGATPTPTVTEVATPTITPTPTPTTSPTPTNLPLFQCGDFITKWGSPCAIGAPAAGCDDPCVDPDGVGPLEAGDGQFCLPADVAVDASGNVYVVDARNNRIQKFDSDGNFILKWGQDGFPIPDPGEFTIGINAIGVDGDGNVWVSDPSVHQVQKFTSTGGFIDRFPSMTGGNPSNLDGKFNNPSDIAFDADGNVFIADHNNNRIQKLDLDGNYLAQWGTECALANPGAPGCVDPDGAGPLELGDGQFFRPGQVAVDAAGNVYVADKFNMRIQKFAPPTPSTATVPHTFVTKWGNPGVQSNNDGELRIPGPLNVGPNSFVYVQDDLGIDTTRIQRFDLTGIYQSKCGGRCEFALGTVGGCTDPDGVGPLVLGDGQLHRASGLAFDGSGNAYIADTGNHRIQKFTTPLLPFEP